MHTKTFPIISYYEYLDYYISTDTLNRFVNSHCIYEISFRDSIDGIDEVYIDRDYYHIDDTLELYQIKTLKSNSKDDTKETIFDTMKP